MDQVASELGIPPSPLAPRTAMGNVSALLSRPNVRSAGEGEGFWEAYRSSAGEQTRGNDVPDAHIAALMRQHGVATTYTRDRGYRRFEGIRAHDPFA